MGRRYGRPDVNRVFSKREQRGLCTNDRIWVVEGIGKLRKKFSLAASFTFSTPHHQPFPRAVFGFDGGDFKCAYIGLGNSYEDKIPLDQQSLPWFAKLHSGYITKQKFFNDITRETEIVLGLKNVVGEECTAA